MFQTKMGFQDGLAQSRLAVLALAEELGSVTEACRQAGISRSRFYELKRAFQSHGTAGLVARPHSKPRMPNQTPHELEQIILDLTLQFPTYSYVRISKKLRDCGVKAPASSVRAIWERHELTTCQERLRFLQRRIGTLSVRHARLLRSRRPSPFPKANTGGCATDVPSGRAGRCPTVFR